MSAHHRTAAWAKVQRTMRPVLAATLPAPCVNHCNRDVQPDHLWDIGHIIDAAEGKRRGWTEAQINHPSNLGPAHVKCNRSDGGKAGRAKQLAGLRKKRRLPQW